MTPEQVEVAISRTVSVLLTLVVAAFVYRLARRGLTELHREGHLTGIMAARLTRIVRWLVVGSALLLVIQETGIFQGAWAILSAFLAAIAVAFFALWSVLANVVCAVMILVYRPFRMGDHVELMDSSNATYSGIVTDMNLMFITLSDVKSKEVTLLRIPNSMVFLRPHRCKPHNNRVHNSFYDMPAHPS